MVKTRQGSRRTTRKGGLRGGFCDTNFREMVRNGEISPSAEMTPVSRMRRNTLGQTTREHEYQRYHYAYMETLVNYFDDEWFDFDYQIKLIIERRDKKYVATAKQPYRCTSCNKPWSDSDTKDPEYYDIELFKNIPMEKSICLKCKDVQPVIVE